VSTPSALRATTAWAVYERFLTGVRVALDGLADVYDVCPTNDTFGLLYVAVEGIAHARQNWGAIGGSPALSRRDEEYEISGVIVCWSDELDFAPLRPQASAALDAIVAWLLTSPDLGLPRVAGTARLADFDILQALGENGGAEVRVPFLIAATAFNISAL